jgi:hypothetical protein
MAGKTKQLKKRFIQLGSPFPSFFSLFLHESGDFVRVFPVAKSFKRWIPSFGHAGFKPLAKNLDFIRKPGILDEIIQSIRILPQVIELFGNPGGEKPKAPHPIVLRKFLLVLNPI